MEADGAQHVPATGGVLIAANHASHADSLALGLAVGARPVTFLGTRELLDAPVIGPLLPHLGMVPVRRGEADAEAMEQILGLLRSGHAVVVFPEGTRSRSGAVHRPRSGVARLAAAADVPVVPTGLAGAATWWPIDARPRLRGGSVRVAFGPTLTPPADRPADRRAFADRLHHELVRLSGAPRAEGFAPATAAPPHERTVTP